MKFSEATVSTHVFVPKHEVDPDLLDDYVIESAFEDNRHVIRTYAETGRHIGFPRNCLPPGFRAEKVYDLRVTGPKTYGTFTSELRPDQSDIVRRTLAILRTEGGVVIHADPAYGKTVCILNILTELKRRAIVLVHKRDLVWQWVERIIQHTTIPRSQVAVAMDGEVGALDGKNILVGLVHTIGKNCWGETLTHWPGVVVFDEVHSSVPPQTFADVAAMFPAKYRIGATATPRRQDRMHRVFEHHIASSRHHVRAVAPTQNKSVIVIHRYYDRHKMPIEAKSVHAIRAQLFYILMSDPVRNQLIVNYVSSFVSGGRRVIVVSDRIYHLAVLAAMTRKKHPDKQVGFYTNQVAVLDEYWTEIRRTTNTKADLDLTAKYADVIFATYKMLGEGTDLENVSGMIYAMPRTEVEQSKGRIEGPRSGGKKPVVVDIWDMVYPTATGYAKKRMSHYQSVGASVHYRG